MGKLFYILAFLVFMGTAVFLPWIYGTMGLLTLATVAVVGLLLWVAHRWIKAHERTTRP